MLHEQISRSGGPNEGPPTLTWAGDRFLRVSFGDRPTPEAGARVIAACAALQAAAIPGLRDLTPAYTTVLLTFDLETINTETESTVRNALGRAANTNVSTPSRIVEVPVCYDATHGEDLTELAKARGLSVEEVIRIHCSAEYTVAYIGFTPGFPYLRGLPEALATPRLSSPRPRIPAGSIGIAGTQTGIYPGGTPGGWQLIGRTPLRIFNTDRHPPSLLSMGDQVRFIPISAADFDAQAAANKTGER